MSKWTRATALIMAFAMMASLAACGGGSSKADTPAAEGGSNAAAETPAAGEAKDTTIAVGTTNTYLYMNPAGANQCDSFSYYMLYSVLFDIDPATGEFYSPISDDWGWDDETTLRITVKDGITFASGSKLDANDILATMQFNNTCGNQNAGKWAGFIDFENSSVSDDGMTLYLKYFSVYGGALAEIMIPVMDDEFMAAHPDDDEIWWNGPDGSGPYAVKEAVNGSYITYELRDDYWDTSKSFDCTEVTVRYYSDANTMWVDYQNGVIDAVMGLDETQINAIESGAVEGTVVMANTNAVPALVMNENNQYLKDIEVRKAICHAIDWNAVGDIAFGSLASPATSHWAATTTAYAEHEGYTYDPDMAKQILADAGYAEGEIVLSYVAVNQTTQVRIMEAVQGYLSDVGITVDCASYELGTALPEYYFVGKNDLALIQPNGANNSRDIWQILSATYNGLFVDRAISDPEYIALLEETLNTADQSERDAAFKELDDWLYDNYWMPPFCEVSEAWCYNSRIASYDMLNIGYDCLGNAKLA